MLPLEMAAQATHWFSSKKAKMFAVIETNTHKVLGAVFAEKVEHINIEHPNTYGVEMTLENSPAGLGFIWNGKTFLKQIEKEVE